MKYIISSVLIALLSVSSLYAGENHSSVNDKPEFKEVQKLDMDFEVELNDDGKTVTASWDDFPSEEGFLWYKLMYSTTNSAPVYPDQGAVFVGTNRTDVENSFKLKYGKNHYIRLCVVTEEEDYQKGRYCSDVKKIEANTIGSVKNYVAKKTDTTKEKYSENKEEYKEQKSEVSSRLKDRVDGMVEKFMAKLESKGYSTEQKVTAVERVVDKLEALKEKNSRYERLVSYMIEKFEAQLSEIDDGVDAIEDILNDF